MKKAIFPGSFDPVTLGHMDIIERAARLSDFLTVLVMANSEKKPLFTLDERVRQLRLLTKDYGNVSVESGKGLTVDCAKRLDASVIIRSVRSMRDVDYETQMAEVNKRLMSGIETIFLNARPEYAYISSTIVKELLCYNACIDLMVPDYIKKELAEKMKTKE